MEVNNFEQKFTDGAYNAGKALGVFIGIFIVSILVIGTVLVEAQERENKRSQTQ